MAISVEEIRELREMTSCGVIECKKALEEAKGDIERAKELERLSALTNQNPQEFFERALGHERLIVLENEKGRKVYRKVAGPRYYKLPDQGYDFSEPGS